MQVLTPSIPKILRITDTMIEDLLMDPVMAAEVLLGYRMDVFQAVRLRTYWFVPNVMDSSGYSSGKTLTDWCFCALRNLLLPEHDCGVYFPVFETGKSTFWRYFTTCKSRIFHAHLGRTTMDGDEAGEGRVQGAAAYKAYYRNGGTLLMPAPSFMKRAETQASLRFNTMVIEEWPKIDCSIGGHEGMEQLYGRVTKESYNQHNPIWCNHIVVSGTAETRMHPGVKRYKTYVKHMESGDPNWAHISFSYKDYSDRPYKEGKTFRQAFRIESNIATMQATMTPADWLGEGLGIWAESGSGWFAEEMLLAAVAQGTRAGLRPEIGRGNENVRTEPPPQATARDT